MNTLIWMERELLERLYSNNFLNETKLTCKVSGRRFFIIRSITDLSFFYSERQDSRSSNIVRKKRIGSHRAENCEDIINSVEL